MNKSEAVSFRNVDVKNGFWFNRMEINKDVSIYSVKNRFVETGRFEAFKFNWKQDANLPKPHIFWDSDIAKWIESVSYIITKSPNEELIGNIEEIIDLIEKNQCEDGYFNIFHTVCEPENRFMKRDNHELYCLGHLIEAATAYYLATGKDRLIKILDKYIDYVIKVFCVEKSSAFSSPGHEEIELALVKLYRIKKEQKYLDLALFFLNERGKDNEGETNWCYASYSQSHKPIRMQDEAVGHCVRACYLYTAMADIAYETNDEQLLSVCRALFDDIVNKKMYISGGIGSSHEGEAFTIAYDLPNDTAYAETCASIALLMFANRMKDIDFNSKYADIVEKEMYNGILSGVSLDGKAFFYENPLEINLSERTRNKCVKRSNERFPITRRREVFDCSCCPPNVTRFIASIGDTCFSKNDNSIFVHQFIDCESTIDDTVIKIKTAYPKNGSIQIEVNNSNKKELFVRIPSWCKEFSSSQKYVVQNGYAKFSIEGDANIDIDFNMTVKFISASFLVRKNAGKVAVMYGPVLYCAEQIDNEHMLSSIRVDTRQEPIIKYNENYFANELILKGFYNKINASLYYDIDEDVETDTEIKLIPYFAFANRDECDMAVWLRR